MRMIEWRQLALAHEFAGADLDDGDTRCVMEVRNDPLGHMLDPHSPGTATPTCIKSGLRRVALARARHHSHLGYQWLAKSALARRQAKTFSNLPRQRAIPMTANFLA
jgi:hypothetical protein